MRTQFKFGILLVLIAFLTSVSPTLPTISDGKVLKLVNTDRNRHGLPPLNLSPLLTRAALAKAEDMVKNDYFNHISPTGVTPWKFFRSSGYNYSYAGENLAINYTDPSDLESSWMNSPQHRANILSPNYSDLGLAVVTTGQKTLIVQFFGSKSPSLSYNR